MDYTLLYFVQTNIICAIMLAYMAVKLKKRSEADTGSGFILVNIILLGIVMCMTDMVIAKLLLSSFSGVEALQKISMCGYLVITILVAYEWLVLCMHEVRIFDDVLKKAVRYAFIPAGIAMLMIVSSPFTPLRINLEETTRGCFLSLITFVVSIGYILASLGLIINAMRRATTRSRKAELQPMMYFILPLILFGTIQFFTPTISVIQIGITCSVFIIYEGWQDNVIQTDALTRLNNRRALVNYLEYNIHRDETVKMTFIMIDVNNFKKINDTYGHLAGDKVLTMIATSIKLAGSQCRAAFICRYGGDEFLVAGRNIEHKEAEEFVANVKKAIPQGARDANIRFPVTISTGISIGSCSDYNDIRALINKADEKMYENKRAEANSAEKSDNLALI